VALVFLISAFCAETWTLVSKYFELFVLTDPFQEKVETLQTCYCELCHTCEKLLLQCSPARLDVHLHCLSFERLLEIHVKVLQVQHTWLVEKCLSHQVPSAKVLLPMAKRQSRLLREHDNCRDQLQQLLKSVDMNADFLDVNTAVAPSPPPNITEPSELDRNAALSEEMKVADNDRSNNGAEDCLFFLRCQHLYSTYSELLGIMHVIFRIYPSQAAKLRTLYKPTGMPEGDEWSQREAVSTSSAAATAAVSDLKKDIHEAGSRSIVSLNCRGDEQL
jgi:hypothetical protein